MSTESLLTSPLHDRHVALGAKMADFGGWLMPIEYPGEGGVLREHLMLWNTQQPRGKGRGWNLNASMPGKGCGEFVGADAQFIGYRVSIGAGALEMLDELLSVDINVGGIDMRDRAFQHIGKLAGVEQRGLGRARLRFELIGRRNCTAMGVQIQPKIDAARDSAKADASLRSGSSS